MPQSGHLKAKKFGPFDVNQLFAQIRMAISITDPQGRMVAWNDNLVGYLGEHQEGAVIFDRIASDMDRRRLMDLAEHACAGNAPVANQILQLRGIDGQERTFSVAASCLSQGDMRYLLWEISPIEVEVATFPNIIMIKEKEAAVAQAEQYRHDILDSFTEGLVEFSADGVHHDINDAFADLLGYSKEKLLEPNFGWAHITPPEFKAQDQHYIESALAGENESICRGRSPADLCRRTRTRIRGGGSGGAASGAIQCRQFQGDQKPYQPDCRIDERGQRPVGQKRSVLCLDPQGH